MNFLEIFAKIHAIVGNLFLLFHALCGTVFSRFSSLVFAPAVAPCAKSFFTAKISFSTTSHRSTRAKRQDHAAFARYAHMLPGGETRLQRSSAPSRTRAQLRRHGTPFLSSAFFEQYAHIASGFATTPSCPVRAFAHYARERPCARSGAPTLFGAAAFALRKCAEPFLFPKLKKRDRPSFFVKKASLCRFLAARRFSGTAFCRRKEIRAFHYAYFMAASGIDPSAPSQTAVFAAISGFPACIVSFPVCGRVSKNRRRSRALNAFREVIAATSAHIRSASRCCRLSAFNAKASSSSATLRARVVPLDSPPRKPLSTF